MLTEDFDYHLPSELIAQTPLSSRDKSRLLVVNRASETLSHSRFQSLPSLLSSGDVIVINDTRVVPARIVANRIPTGGKVELLLLEQLGPSQWLCRGNPGKSMRIGQLISIATDHTITAQVVANGRDNSERVVEFGVPISPEKVAQLALPPYIKTTLTDPNRYQTVYAEAPGSIAAPTAGLHFTNELLSKLKDNGIEIVTITLHVNKGTFIPIKTSNPRQHSLHEEYCSITEQAATSINRALSEKRRVIAIGTTSVRTLEQATIYRDSEGQRLIQPSSRMTDLYILPGFNFQVISGLVTNFHLPKSSLLMLVSAFAGSELTKRAYAEAVANSYRFYSFGDAMLVI